MSAFWQAALSTLAGVVVAFVLVAGRERWRERSRFTVEIVAGKCCYALQKRLWGNAPYGPVPAGELVWQSCPSSEPEAALLVQLDLLAQNSSYLDDGIRDIRLVIHRASPLVVNCPAQQGDGERKGEPFFGSNVRAHSLVHLRLLFQFPKDVYGQFPEWEFQRDTIYELDAKTVRGSSKTLRMEPVAYHLLGVPDGDRVDI